MHGTLRTWWRLLPAWQPGISGLPPIPQLVTVCDVTRPIVFPEPSVPRDGWLGWAEPLVNLYLESSPSRLEAVAARQPVDPQVRQPIRRRLVPR